MAPSVILYLKRRDDFDSSLLGASSARPTSWCRLLRTLVAYPPDVLEIPEPLWLRYILQVNILLIAFRVLRPKRARKTLIVSYAIENAAVGARPRSLPLLPERLWAFLVKIMTYLPMRMVDRLVYGTEGSEAAYLPLARRRRRSAECLDDTILALPQSCDCIGGTSPVKVPMVLFVGALEGRKGIDRVLRAWECMDVAPGGFELHIVGQGELAPSVRSAGERLEGIVYHGAVGRTAVHALMKQAQTVVLLSQPEARWREQVGLSIVEGLAHGCRIVCSDQTGLSSWLSLRGHSVLAFDAPPDSLRDALTKSMTSGPTPREIHQSLPKIDGRLAADNYLLQGVKEMQRTELRSP